MKSFRQLVAIVFLFAFFNLILSQEAYAYLDPGSGSYIIQMIIGAFLTGLFIMKLLWNKIKLFFNNLFSKEKTRKKDGE